MRKIICTIMTLVMIFGCVSFAFANTSSSISKSANTVSLETKIKDAINAISDTEKKQKILQYLEPIYVTTADEIRDDELTVKQDTLDTIKELSQLTNSELDAKLSRGLSQAMIAAKCSEDVYFLEEGVKRVKKDYPTQLNKIQTVSDLKKVSEPTLRKDFASVAKISTPDRDYSKANTVYFKNYEGIALRLAVQINWSVRNHKISKRSSKFEPRTNGLWSINKKKKTADKITNAGQRGHIEYSVRFTHNIGGAIKTLTNGAWFYNDGGYDWNL